MTYFAFRTRNSGERVIALSDDFFRLGAVLDWVGPQRKSISKSKEGTPVENIDDVCIRYDGGRVAANESLVAEINARGLRRTTKETGLDRKTIRAILKGGKVKASTLAKVVMGLRG